MTTTLSQIENEARQIARRPGATETEQQAFARLLEANPEAYEAYRAQHNAKALVGTLEAAGIRLKR